MVAVESPTPGIDPGALRAAMGRFTTGVTVITSGNDDDLHAMTANAFMSVSLDPPLVLVSLGNRSRMAARLQDTDHYGVSVLAHSQESLARRFAGSRHATAPPRFDRLGPVLVVPAALVQLSARIVDRHLVGDHTLFIGLVEHLAMGEGDPLLFHTGAFSLVQGSAARDLWDV